MQFLRELALYFAHVFTDGDWMNDWLTHLPAWVAAWAMIVGRALATALGL